jgi:hypothetical protein
MKVRERLTKKCRPGRTRTRTTVFTEDSSPRMIYPAMTKIPTGQIEGSITDNGRKTDEDI